MRNVVDFGLVCYLKGASCVLTLDHHVWPPYASWLIGLCAFFFWHSHWSWVSDTACELVSAPSAFDQHLFDSQDLKRVFHRELMPIPDKIVKQLPLTFCEQWFS